jgi:hypothetical protein
MTRGADGSERDTMMARRPRMAGFGYRIAVLLVAAAALGPGAAGAAELPGPTADFSGTMVITYPPSKPLSIRIDYTAQRIRREMFAFGTKFIFIVDRTRNKTIVLFPQLKRYAIRPLRPGEHDTVRRLARDATLEKIGPDTVDGVETVKYRLAGKSLRGRRFSGFLWLTRQNIMIRMEGETTVKDKKRRLTIVMRDLRVGPVDPAVFAIPPGYEKVDRKQPKKRRPGNRPPANKPPSGR